MKILEHHHHRRRHRRPAAAAAAVAVRRDEGKSAREVQRLAIPRLPLLPSRRRTSRLSYDNVRWHEPNRGVGVAPAFFRVRSYVRA